MRNCNNVKGKMFLFLVAAILVLSAGFLIVGCGAAPGQKSLNKDVSNTAIDFSLCPAGETCQLNVSNANFPNIVGNTLTIEAWIKPKASSTAASGIFGRYDSKGALLWVKNTNTSTLNTPKFAIRVKDAVATTSTDYTVTSAAGLTNDTWYHIAGVLSNTDHSSSDTGGNHLSIDCADGNGNATGGNAETPHVDIYIDGVITACGTTWGNSSDPATAAQGVEDPTRDADADVDTNNAQIGFLNASYLPYVDGNGLASDTQFEGIIEEVRLWTSERTAANIANCMNAELSTTSAECSVDDANLIGYWRFNEASGYDVYGRSGNSVSGALEYGSTHWTGGWVTGKY